MKNIYLNLLHIMFFLTVTSLCGMELTTKEQDPIEQEYFKGVPKKYKDIFATTIDVYKNNTDKAKTNYIKMYHLLAITNQDKYKINNEPLPFQNPSGYWMLKQDNNLCTGKSNHNNGFTCLSLRNDSRTERDKPDFIQKLVQGYKIHLMPKGPAFEDFEELIQLIQQDQVLQKTIVSFKVSTDNLDDEQIIQDYNQNKEIFPKIVIYPAAGKDNAQIALNELLAAFGHKDGLNITPRNNTKVTSYIYYAQGNGDDKKIDAFKKYFEQPDMVHYKSNVTGEKQNYHLYTSWPSWLYLSLINKYYALHNTVTTHYKKLILLGSLGSFITYAYLHKK